MTGLGTRRARPAARGLRPAGSGPLQKGTLVLSPHFDDAALSIGGALAARAFPYPVCIYTVFGVSNYTRSCFHAHWRPVTSLRQQEERSFTASLDIACAFAEFKEAGLRIGSDFRSIFCVRGNANPSKPARFDRALRDIVLEYRPRLLVCPLGIGDHWDHLLVYRAVRKMHLGNHLPVLFYEDLPYAARVGPRGAESAVASLDHRFRSITIPIDLAKKCAGLAYYPSQLGEEDVFHIREYAEELAKRKRKKGPCERLWTSNPALIALLRRSVTCPSK